MPNPEEPVVLATQNRDKIREIRDILAGIDVPLFTFEDFTGWPDVEEEGASFKENALVKARAIADFTGMRALADDSGLQVDCLGGEPGIHSARYAGPNGEYEANNSKLLAAMEGVPLERRRARFVCWAALVNPDGTEHTAEGVIEGTIIEENRGPGGFGYDPVFVPEGMERTMAELSEAEKNAISHRARALCKLIPYL